MINPFKEDYIVESTDEYLVDSVIKEGNQRALEELIHKHQGWIYNIALRMVWNPQDAEDVTQEVLIKVITKLSTFRGESSFRTWLYRIVSNTMINMKKRRTEEMISNFDCYGKALDQFPALDFPDEYTDMVESKILIEEAKIGCTMGMLLCLDRDQRLVYILGEIFDVSDITASQILDMSKDNFRKKLSRTRKQLYNFMKVKCGLINEDNPCRCAKKTKSFIQAGIVDPHNLKFNKDYVKRIKELSESKSQKLDLLIESSYAQLFREQPFQNGPDLVKRLRNILHRIEFQNIFNLED